MAKVLLHIVSRSEYDAAVASGTGAYRPASLASEGFIHLSGPEQVLFPANAFYRGQVGLVLLVLDPAKLLPEIRYEAADGQAFPHLYGPLNLSAVTDVLPFEPQPDGTFVLPSSLN